MSRRKLNGGCFLLFFLFSCVFFPASIKAFPYQSGWPKSISGDIYSSPVVADLDHDGYQEVIFTTFNPFSVYVLKYNGTTLNRAWPKVFSNSGGSAPSVADLDNDGDLEIVAIGQYLYAWHHTGEDVNNFPADSSNAFFWAAPAIGDLTGDDVPEIADGNYECEFYVWDNQGNVLSGFPKSFLTKDGGCIVKYSPAIGDIDLDGINEVVIQTQRKRIYAYNADGSVVSGIWDFEIPPYGGPESDIAMGDIDGDNILEVLFVAHPVAGGGFWPIALNQDTSFVNDWPPLDIINPSTGGLVMADIDDDGKLEVITGTMDGTSLPSIYVWEGESGQIKNGWPVTLSHNDGIDRNVILGDVNGDGSVDIIAVSNYSFSNGRIYAWDINGNLLSGFPIIINGFGPHMTTCFITDIDNDGDVEIGVGVTDTYAHSKLMIWDLPYL